jgi:hypothetical protein
MPPRPTDLHESVQNSIALEFSTIPPYLTAMTSLKANANREIWDILHSVAVDEMLHMLINCNLLVALGGTPAVDNPAIVPSYPGPLPMAIHTGLIVGCEPFSIPLVRDTFMQVERPEDELQFPSAVQPAGYATIGLYYHTLKAKIRELGDAAFRSDDTGQLVNNDWFPPARLFAIVDAETALRAIDLIVREGEGTTTSPEGEPGVIAHFYRFEQIVKGHLLVANQSVPGKHSFTGADVPFDPDGVWPITPNQKLRDLDPDSPAGQRARQFASDFTNLLSALQQAFNGEPDMSDTAMGLMYQMTQAGQTLCATDAVHAGSPTGRKAGPTFEYLSPTDQRSPDCSPSWTHRPARW